MRIIVLTPSVRMLGARRSLHALATRLPADVELMVVCPGPGGLTQRLQSSGIPVEVIPHGAWRKARGRLEALFFQVPKLRDLARRFRPRIIHCNEFHSIPAGVAMAGGIGGSAGVVGHVRLGITPRQIRNYHLERCRLVVAVSEACRAMFEGSGLEARVRVAPNGVDLEELGGAAEGAALRQRWGWGEDDLVAGLLGLVSPRKHQRIAAEAVALANRRGARVRLLLAGDPFKSTLAYGELLRRRLGQPDLVDCARWLPFQERVGPVYGACDVNLLVSSEEGFGRTIIEAAALGLPTIGSRIGGVDELIRGGETGWLIESGSVEALAAALEAAWANRAETRRRGEAARRLALERFTIETHAKRMVEIWREAAEQTNAH